MNAPLFAMPAGTAAFSDCGRYRYRLTRKLGAAPRIACFVMLNPSTADATTDDRTVARCKVFAASWGCGALFVANLFAWRATVPIALYAERDPVGPKNDDYLIGAACRAHESGGPVVAAWGAHGSFLERDRVVMKLLTQTLGIRVQCLGFTAEGFPRHPLYLPKYTELMPYRGRPEGKE